eukprot:2080154-Prymnesium_polylepis.1
MSGEVPQTDHRPPPQGGDEYLVLACGVLVWGSADFHGGGAGFLRASGFLIPPGGPSAEAGQFLRRS